MQTKLVENNSKKLTIFLTGWGCDADQFRFMKSEDSDILICYDYTNLDIAFDFSKYDEFNLISFSAGVCISGLIKDKLPKFNKKISINGNPLAYNQYYGLRKEIIDVFEGVTQSNALDFRRQFLVYDDEEFRKFNANQSHRSFESSLTELVSLKSYDNESVEPMKFDTAVLSEDDKIFFYNRQIEYWSDKAKCVTLHEAAHFPFFRLDNFDKILEL
ncbi:MAG: DUF452 family protein [Cyanobacteria bacterium RUI128]|nr:DUF452 family protein [Cyanobacteria bacterium RUI128]